MIILHPRIVEVHGGSKVTDLLVSFKDTVNIFILIHNVQPFICLLWIQNNIFSKHLFTKDIRAATTGTNFAFEMHLTNASYQDLDSATNEEARNSLIQAADIYVDEADLQRGLASSQQLDFTGQVWMRGKLRRSLLYVKWL